MLVTVPASAGFGGAEPQLDLDEAEHERRLAAGLGVATGARLRRPGRAHGAAPRPARTRRKLSGGALRRSQRG